MERLDGEGRYEEAIPLAERAALLAEKALGSQHPIVAVRLNNLAGLYGKQGRYEAAEPLYVRALGIVELVLGDQHQLVGMTLNNLARLYDAQGRYGEAEPLYLRALRIQEKALGDMHPTVAESLNHLAALYDAQGRYGEAEPLYLRALRIQEKALGDQHPDVAESLNHLAALYWAQDRYEEAKPLRERALNIVEKTLGDQHPDVAASLNHLAALYQAQGQYGEAEPLYLRALRINEKALGDQHQTVAISLNHLALLYQAQGRYGEAEPLYLRALRINEKALGDQHPTVTTSLLGLARLYRGQSRYEEAEPLYLRALRIQEKAQGNMHPQVATILNGLAGLYKAQGRYGAAEPLYQRALRISEKALEDMHPQVATILNGLAGLYKAQGRYGAAEPLYQRALRIYEKALGAQHPQVAMLLNGLAGLYQAQGRYEEAKQLYLRALSIREQALTEQHPDVAASLHSLAALYWAQGRYRAAEPLSLRALGILEKTLGDQHPDVATSLNNLATLYMEQGRYGAVGPLYVRALGILEKALGNQHPDVATSLNNLAGLYQAQGRYEAAEPLYVRALGILEKALGDQHPDVAGSLNNLAGLYDAQGRYGAAEPLYVRALGIEEKALGDQHPDVATSLNNLAALYKEQGRYGEAEPLFLRALGIVEQALGERHPNVAKSLNNLAGLYSEQGRYEAAEPLLLRALSIKEKVLGDQHPDVATSLNNLAGLYQNQGWYGAAESLLLRALGINKRTLREQHPNMATSLNNLASLYLAQTDIDRAITYAEQAERASDEHLSAMMRHGSEQQKHAFMAQGIVEVDFGVGLALLAPGDVRAQSLAMRHLLRRKGRVLDAMRSTLAAVRDNLDEDGQVLLDQYLTIRSQYSTQYLRGPQNIVLAQHHENLAELEKQKRDIEVKLSEKSRQFAEVNRTVTLDDIRKALPGDAALIEWIRYQPFDPSAPMRKDHWQPARYAACVLARHGAPKCLDLSNAVMIDNVALAFHRAVALGLESRALARTLDALIMAPVRRTLGNARKLYLSPDGALQLIPFAALLHQDADGLERYLVEQFELVYVTSGRDLVRAPRTDVPPGPVTVLGNPRYSVPGSSSRDRFPRLHGTRQESEEIGALFAGARVLMDADADEATLKGARAPWIMHLATHAYFGAEDCAGQPQATDNPLLGAGLALAGANACHDGSGSDGVLTGEELAGLNLYGTQLVVLSACDTGIGALALRDEKRLIGVRDGVYGLRRALMLAGAETQVVSLWKVNDLATQELMAAYYRALLQGQGRAEALRQVQLTMLRSPARAHPYYWASFVVVGMDAPLRLPPGQGRLVPRGSRGCACDVGADSPAPGWAMLVPALVVLAWLRRRPRPGRLAALVLLAAIALLAACNAGRQPDTPTSMYSDEAAVARVLDWTLGPTRAPPSRGRARLLWHTAGQPLERAHPVTTCEENTHSLLSAPDGSGVYLAVNGAIVFVATFEGMFKLGHEIRPTPLAMTPPGVHVLRLLAFMREHQPPIILAQVEEGVPARETLWLFHIQDRAAVGKRVEDYADFVDASTFYQRFDNPRCDAELRNCIVVSVYGGDTIVSIEVKQGHLPRAELEKLRGAGISDMTWARNASPRAQLILHRCDE